MEREELNSDVEQEAKRYMIRQRARAALTLLQILREKYSHLEEKELVRKLPLFIDRMPE